VLLELLLGMALSKLVDCVQDKIPAASMRQRECVSESERAIDRSRARERERVRARERERERARARIESARESVCERARERERLCMRVCTGA
jgi:hypothetical protein